MGQKAVTFKEHLAKSKRASEDFMEKIAKANKGEKSKEEKSKEEKKD